METIQAQRISADNTRPPYWIYEKTYFEFAPHLSAILSHLQIDDRLYTATSISSTLCA